MGPRTGSYFRVEIVDGCAGSCIWSKWTNKAIRRRNSELVDCQRSKEWVRRTHSSECQAYPSRCDRSTAAARTRRTDWRWGFVFRSEEHTSELQSLRHLVCRLLLEKKR